MYWAAPSLDQQNTLVVLGSSQCGHQAVSPLQAYRLNLFGSGYQWLLASGPGPVWTLDPEASGCSLYALHAVLEGSIRPSLPPLGDSGLRGVSGRVRVLLV